MSSYEVDANNREIYPKRLGYGEIVVGGRYAKNPDGSFYYPKDDDENEYMVERLYMIQRNGEYVYPLTARGKPRYPLDSDGLTELYERVDGKWLIGVGADKNEYYARNKKGDEYYPEDKTVAKLADGTPFYASTANGRLIFPKDCEGNEFYISLLDYRHPRTVPNRYAKCKLGYEIYPLKLMVDNTKPQALINNRYALAEENRPYYPKDGYNNEYYRAFDEDDLVEYSTHGTIDNILLQNYAVTNDGKIILPGLRDGNFYIDLLRRPLVKPENVLGMLVRINNMAVDFLTDVDSPNLSLTQRKPYKYLTNSGETKVIVPKQIPVIQIFATTIQTARLPFHKTWCFWVIVVLALIIKSFAIWWFLFKARVPFTLK